MPKNIENAGQLYSLAANQGHGPATLALARLVYEGIGTKSDPVKAWALATLAVERGEKEADKLVKEIAVQTRRKTTRRGGQGTRRHQVRQAGKKDEAKPDAPKTADADLPMPSQRSQAVQRKPAK